MPKKTDVKIDTPATPTMADLERELAEAIEARDAPQRRVEAAQASLKKARSREEGARETALADLRRRRPDVAAFLDSLTAAGREAERLMHVHRIDRQQEPQHFQRWRFLCFEHRRLSSLPVASLEALDLAAERRRLGIAPPAPPKPVKTEDVGAYVEKQQAQPMSTTATRSIARTS